MLKMVAVLTAVVALAGCATEPGGRPDDGAASLKAADLAFARAVHDHDRRAFAAAVAEDAVFHGATVLHGRAAVVDAWAPLLAENRSTELSWEPTSAEVAMSGELGYTRGTYRLTRRGEDGVEELSEGAYVTVWRLASDGAWQAAVDIGTEPKPLGRAERATTP